MEATVDHARTLLTAAREVVDRAVSRLAGDVRGSNARVDLARLDREQALVYDLSAAACLVGAGEAMLEWGESGGLAAMLTTAYSGHVAAEVAARVQGRERAWGVEALPWHHGDVAQAFAAARSVELLERITEQVIAGPLPSPPLTDELDMARRVFRDFAREKVAPLAEAVHRNDHDVPESLISDFARMGLFGMGITEEYGGSASGGPAGHSENDLLAMVVATEEITRGSMGLAGPFITRPEILATALLKGGEEEQAKRWLPDVASGELMVGVAVTEPDYGSDVAGLTTTATREGNHYRINGVKTWSTFSGRADLLLLLARTGTREDRHRGLSLFVIEKPRFPGHAWIHEGEHGGRIDARAISTIGYRGMHSFEISFEDYLVPAENLIGGDAGLGRGFYLQMNAFANGRMQTAARAVGLMRAAYEAAARYTQERHVFGSALADYQLTRTKLARMAYLVTACQAYTYRCAHLIAEGGGQLEASMVKSLACNAAEWVTREAQQLHGGYGYAEEYPVSRYFLDARVLSLFEGADETLAVRVIAKGLAERTLR
ncbi:acyl-CoA dehydrogenase family protein [Pseudonocardia kunmingensis]|uniref:(2S)-methylsuccinyl-CoA dehydrogenase n=1 Tax=Pseudonocardia kunmingensis TaxID=630975 RepID=A0A543DVE8_9PSEU|nr:acyl-CoA dehydrogenase family protein [Pseudonocardia kunmingensis]TQM13293.1 (2S)-methylsuccinyl-CoA dehydrogenase [Pseudonocardia kunmingensis]